MLTFHPVGLIGKKSALYVKKKPIKLDKKKNRL